MIYPREWSHSPRNGAPVGDVSAADRGNIVPPEDRYQSRAATRCRNVAMEPRVVWFVTL